MITNLQPFQTDSARSSTAFFEGGQEVVCHECQNKVRLPNLISKQKAVCPRCGYRLTQFHHQAEQRIIALSLTALIFLGLSLPFEFLGFSANGRTQSIGIPASIDILISQDYLSLAIIQLLAIVIVPAIILIGLLYLLIPLQFGIRPIRAKFTLRLVYWLLPWGMAEIFLVGVLVSLIKISSMAEIDIGLSFFAYIGFTLSMTAAVLHLDKHQLEQALDTQITHTSKISPSESIQRTWALLMTSIILYIPANTLPIMNTIVLGRDDPSTILGGVVLLWEMGSYPIAAVIFVASVLVPVAKLVILIWLNYSVQKGFNARQEERVFWYRVTEFIGRWSMVDVFVVAILVSLIQLGNTISILPGPAALAFCGVVILTMLAAMTFDTNLIWKNRSKHYE